MSDEPVVGPEVSAEDGPSGVEALQDHGPGVADLIATATRVADWLVKCSAWSARQAEDMRFPGLAEANRKDAANFKATADSLRASIAHAAGRTTHEPEEGQKR